MFKTIILRIMPPRWLSGKEFICDAGDTRETGSIPGFDPLEKGIATHTSILAYRIHGQRSLAG